MPELNTGVSVERRDDGTWHARLADSVQPDARHFAGLCVRTLTQLEPAFLQAKAVSEFEFVCAILRLGSVQDAGWDPYETSLQAVPLIVGLNNSTDDALTQAHLQLWTYLHVVEASAPFELLTNLLRIGLGERHNIQNFPRQTNVRRKLLKVQELAARIGHPEIAVPIREMWDRDLRNSIAHADYSLYGGELRMLNVARRFANNEVHELVQRAFAYHTAVSLLIRVHIESYAEPRVVDLHPEWHGFPGERAVVLVQEGRGAIGVQAALSKEEIARGRILWRWARCSREAITALQRDPTGWLISADEQPGPT